MFALWIMLCECDCCGRSLVDVVQMHIAHMGCPGARPHLKGEKTDVRKKIVGEILSRVVAGKGLNTRGHYLLLWVRVVCIIWDHFDDGAPCRVTSVQTIVHGSPRPLCHGRVGGQHGPSIH